MMSASSLLAMETSISVVNALAVYKIATKKDLENYYKLKKLLESYIAVLINISFIKCKEFKKDNKFFPESTFCVECFKIFILE